MIEDDDIDALVDDDRDEDPDFGCLYPDECCVPGLHYTDECYTAEWADQYFAEEPQPKDQQ